MTRLLLVCGSLRAPSLGSTGASVVVTDAQLVARLVAVAGVLTA